MKKKLLLDSSSFSRKLPFFEKLTNKEKDQITKDSRYDAIYAYSLSNCFVTPYGAVIKNGLVIKESLYRNYTKNVLMQYPSFYKKLFSRKYVKIEGECIVAHHSWYDNYYHWLIEIVPRLFLLKDLAPQTTLIIHSRIKPFHKEILSFFGFKTIFFLNENELALAEKVTFPSYNRSDKKYRLHNYLSEPGMNKTLLQKTSEWIVSKTAGQTTETYSKIYISRDKAMHRKVLNEAELTSFLSAEGFTTVYMEDHDFGKQVNIINNASVIVGVCGAGLSNILFMKKNASVLNLIHKDVEEFCFFNLANAMDVNYAHVSCEGNSKPNSAFNDIIVNLNDLKTALHSITQKKL